MKNLQVYVSAIDMDLNTAAVGIRVPLVRGCEVVEFGVFNFSTDAGDSDGALELIVYDGAATVTILQTLLGSGSFDVGEILVGRCSVFIDTVSNRYLSSLAGTPGTSTEDAQGLTCLGVRIKSGATFASSAVGQLYLVVQWNGASGDVTTGQVAGTVS
jgi:hypothetical protein